MDEHRFIFAAGRGRSAWISSLPLVAWISIVAAGTCRDAPAAPPRVLPPGQVPADTRLGPLKGERGEFPFRPPKSAGEWQQRAGRVRQILRVALGLWPMPTNTPLNAVVHGKIDRGDYTVEKVYFESLPGFFVTGNLYRPKGSGEKRPGVLSPHGHFPGGRFQDAGRETVRRQIVEGAERFEEGGRSFMQSRCVQLARMGCVVFHYDMIGYADSVQVPLEVVHRFAPQRITFKQAPATGFYSASAEQHLVNPMGLHTFNSMRAIDFLISLPEVDPRRIAVTGASGGGTQTFMLCAVDERPLVSVPVVILSPTRQGGCTCENISGLRIGTYNYDFTALHAPRPLLVISAGDGTDQFGERGFPEIRRLYEVLGAPKSIAHEALHQFGHNYNLVSRCAMYHWLNRHLELGLKEPIVERPYERLTEAEMSVWDENHPRPPSTPDFERRLVNWFADDAGRQIAALAAGDNKSLDRYREVVGGAWDVLLRQRLSDLSREPGVEFRRTQESSRNRFRETLGWLQYRSVEGHRAALPMAILDPEESGPLVVIWIDQAGKSGLYQDDGSPRPVVRRLLQAGATVVGADLLDQGEFLIGGGPVKGQRSLVGEEAFAGWTYCYNLPLLARRVHDILALVAWARGTGSGEREVSVVGLGGVGPWVALAAVQAQGAITRAAIDTGGFRFARLTDVYDVNFLPGAVKYGDLPGALALAAPTRLWLAGEGQQPPAIVRAAYAAAGGAERLTMHPRPSGAAEAAVQWLLER